MAFSLALIIILGLTADYLFRRINLPGLVGMLFVGIFVGPSLLNLMPPEMMNVSGDFRKIALVVILLRAGLELRRETLHRVGRATLLMSVLPAVFEMLGVAIFAAYLLPFTYLDSLILGTILGAVSPAVVVPLMVEFIDQGRGAKKGIPTLILGASSLDDVFVIVLFTVFLGMHGNGNLNLWTKLAGIPVSIILGVLIGLIPGYILYRLFVKYDWKPPKRTIMVLGIAIMLTWIEDYYSKVVPIAGLLGVMSIGFIILEKSEPIAHIISQKLKKVWVFAELLLFVLVGAQVDISVAWEAGLTGILVILIGLVFRSIGSMISLTGTDFSWKERLFCVVAYVPKATVQAAIGAVPLSAGVAGGDMILAIAVMSIIITAPLGAIGIKLLGKAVLEKDSLSPYRFKDLRDKLEIPRVGQRLRSKRFGTVWKVIEEKEKWREEPGLIPVISLRLWHEDKGGKPGRGKTISYDYSYEDDSFHDHWEIIYDW